MKKITYIFVLITILLSSCYNESSNIFLDKKPTTVMFSNSINLEGERIAIDNFGARDLFITDTFIVFITPQLDEFYSVFSITDYSHYGNLVSKGQGPDEFIFSERPLFTEKYNDALIMAFYDTQRKTLMYLNLTQSLIARDAVFDKFQKFEIYGIYKLFPINEEETFIDYCDFEKLNQHYSIYDNKKQKIIQDETALLSNIKSQGNSYLLAASCCFNQNNNRYASAMNFIDQVNFYDIKYPEKSFCISISNIQTPLSKVENIIMPDKIEYYTELRSNDKYLFGLYVNRNRKDWALEDIPAVIHVFDWDGNPIVQLKTKEKIVYFDIDIINNRLYGMTQNEELYVYSLDLAIGI